MYLLPLKPAEHSCWLRLEEAWINQLKKYLFMNTTKPLDWENNCDFINLLFSCLRFRLHFPGFISLSYPRMWLSHIYPVWTTWKWQVVLHSVMLIQIFLVDDQPTLWGMTDQCVCRTIYKPLKVDSGPTQWKNPSCCSNGNSPKSIFLF